VGHGDDAGALAEQPVKGLVVDAAVLTQGRHLEGSAGALAGLLPGHDVGVVFQGGDQHLVAGLELLATVALGHQVDAFGGALGPDDFLAGGVDELRHGGPGRLEGAGGLVAQVMGGAVHIAVAAFVVVAHGVDHLARLLGGGGVVQVHQGLAVHRLFKDRELRAQGLYIEAHAASSSAPGRPPSSAASHGCAQSATA